MSLAIPINENDHVLGPDDAPALMLNGHLDVVGVEGMVHRPFSADLRDGRISYGWPSRPLRMYPVRIADSQVWIDAGGIKSLAM